jgi:two-component system NtrC family sensor kinase
VLSLRLSGALSDDEKTALRAVADTLAPLLASRVAVQTPTEAQPAVAADDRRFIQKIIDTLPIGLYVIDREYRIQAWNKKRETGLQGVSREEAVGRTIFEILHRQSAATLRAEFDEVFSTGRIWQTEVDTLAGAEQRTYRLSKIPMRMHDGIVTHVITVGEDVTEEKRAQERLGRAEKLAAVGQLAAGVMHEINNPLATIGVCAEGISRKVSASALGEDAHRAVEDKLALIWQEVERCRGIANRLLDFSRPAPLIKSRIDLHAVLERTLLLLAHQPRFRGVEVVKAYDPKEPVNVMGETESMIQAFMALLLNAADSMEMSEYRRVTITTHSATAAREATVEIADEGTGISRMDLSRLFEPFFTTKAPGKGTGLGLAICYGIISDHRGRIDVESTLGKGSIFRVMLPLEDTA